MRFNRYSFIFLLSVLLFTGCSGIPGAFSYDTEGRDYFFGEFTDIPIPKEMNSCIETTIITTPNNIVTGAQVYKGRVELTSLIKVMKNYMRGSGWGLQASTRASKSLLIFEKEDRYCTIYILDGSIFTEMQVFVAPKITDGQATMVLPQTVPASNAGSNAESGPSSGFDSHILSD